MIIFPNSNEHRQKSSSTTTKPITTTFWNSWSATQPNKLTEVQNEHSHSEAFIDSESTTQKPNNGDGLLPWMKDILNDHSTTERPVQTITKVLPSWLQGVLNRHTTSSTTRSPVITTTTEPPNWLKDVLDRQTSSTTTEMPTWMRDVLNNHTTTIKGFSNDHGTTTTTRSWINDISTIQTLLPSRSTTAKSNFGDGFLSNANSSHGGVGLEFIDLTETDRYSQ